MCDRKGMSPVSDPAELASDVLIDVAELQRLMAQGSRPRVLDVRWTLAQPDGLPEYRAGHIPGAAYADLEHELSTAGAPTDGRHPLPSIETLQRAARRWGISTGDAVVVYDDSANFAAGRAWWLLRHAGVQDVRMLDGGLNAWREAGLPLATGDENPEPGNVSLRYGSLPTVDADGAAAMARAGVLLDARAAERYRGETEPIDPRAGHIPGAVSAPTTDNVDAGGRFLPPSALAKRFAALGVGPDRPVGVYCGSGVNAAHEIAAVAIAGFPAVLYPGSWSQWSNLPDRPVATGADPAGNAPDADREEQHRH